MARQKPRSGLILLVVLGMLALLSLLSVTYLVFSSEARKAASQQARGDHRGTPPDKLIDQAVRQVIRGTTDSRSPIWLNDILGDLYGESTADPFQIHEARSTALVNPPVAVYGVALPPMIARDNPLRVQQSSYVMPPGLTTYNSVSPESPRLYDGHLLKIPIAWPITTGPATAKLPEQDDAWTGRVLTFTEGPLQGQSFRIVRYIGEVGIVPGAGTPPAPTLDPTQAANQYSVLIDLSEVRDRVTSKKYGTTMVTRSVSDWISLSAASNCLDLLFQNVTGTAPTFTFTDPYNFFISAGVTNSNGLGMDVAGNVTYTPLTPTPGTPPTPSVYANMIPDAFLANHARTRADQGNTYTPAGDTDEPIDAASFQDFYLAMRQPDPVGGLTGSDDSDRITPSFHRQAVINYLMSPGIIPNLSSFTGTAAQRKQFTDYLELLQRATARPLSITVRNFFGAGNDLKVHSSFTGSNPADNRAGFGMRTPQLVLDWSSINTPAEVNRFQNWLRFLTRGPWDVDNDGDLVNDSIWMDLNFPLITSPEGKLLKVLAAFYIEDMDGKLDLNAAGSREQADDIVFNQGRANGGANNKYAYLRDYGGAGSVNTHWTHGTGYGPADISLRPLFDPPTPGAPPSSPTPSPAYGNFLNYRYGSAGALDSFPGLPSTNDAVSYLNERFFISGTQRSYRGHNPGASPVTGHAINCFPFSVRGRAGITVDLLGNPIYFENDGTFNETTDDPYDVHVLKDRYSDRGITVSDWERLARFNDVDRSALPAVLQRISSSTLAPGTAGYLSRVRSVSPRNVTLNLPRFAGEYNYLRWQPNTPTPTMQPVTRRVSSFVEFVEAYAQARFPAVPIRPIFSTALLRQLFPIEFRQNMPLNINRPLGNGTDDQVTLPGTPPTVIHPYNGIIDEADEIRLGQAARYPNGVVSSVNEEYARGGSSFDPDLEAETTPPAPQIDPRITFDGNQPKQLLARHLYCLAQLILPDTYVFPSAPTGLSAAEQVQYRARVLAQWAINIVDFRDADSAMTRFAYDENPFDGWTPNSGVVFGVETPELLITESLAFHDQRIRRRSSGMPPFEQFRIPEGSLYLEFYCPRTTMPGATSGVVDGTIPPPMAGLYEFTSSGELKLSLGAMTPVNATNPIAFPVWRVVFTQPSRTGGAGGTYKDRLTEVYEGANRRSQYSYQFDGFPSAPSNTDKVPWSYLASGTIAEPTIDRILWFSGATPTVDNVAWSDTNAVDKVFTGYAGSNYLSGGQYLVVGPRDITYLGSRDTGAGTGPRDNNPSRQRIQINNSTTSDWVQMWNMNNDPLFWKTPGPPLVQNNMPTGAANWSFAGNVRDAVTLVAGIDKPASWTDPSHATYKIGLNISEPTRNSYYPEPTELANSGNNSPDPDTNAPGFANLPKDSYIDTDTGAATSLPPLDCDGSPHAYLQQRDWQVVTTATATERLQVKTEDDWSAAVLQRLADPTRGWHERYNPYITVDWLPIDLTVFSGEERIAPDGTMNLATRRKTGATVPIAVASSAQINEGSTFYSLHNVRGTGSTMPTGDASNPYFDFELPMEYVCTSTPSTALTRGNIATAGFTTLGYLNPQFTLRGTVGPPTGTDDYRYTIDSRYNGSPGPNVIGGGIPLNVPLAPYFPNRDFVNVLELTSVPISSPCGLMQDFGVDMTAVNSRPLFTHTLDFEDLQTPNPTATPAPLNQKRTSAMLLELLATKNPWPDASKVENPANLVVPGYNPATATPEQHARQALFEPYRAPLNFIPTYREPGKINLNTLNESTVFRGLMWNAITPSASNAGSWYTTLTEKLTSTGIPYWTEFQNLRRGFNIVAPSATPIPLANPYLNPAYPFEFAHPFTTSTAYDKAPSPSMQYDRASHSGLLRRGETVTAPFDMATSAVAKPRLFNADVNNVFPDAATAGNVPLNTFIRNYPASRLANLTTDRSSVFAIRVTLGYFEADSAGNLGDEYGFDQGESTRHRAIYIIDRSIPVGYQPGQDINTDNIILLRRMIE